MKRQVVGLAVVLTMAMGMAARLHAAPFAPKQVSTDAKWAIHINYDEMRNSVVARKAWDALMKRVPAAGEHLAKAREMLGFDPVEDLHGTTIYGKKIGDPKGVMIVQVKADKAKLEALVAKAKDYKVSEYGAYKLHCWTHQDKHGSHPVCGTFHGDDAIVLAACVDDLKAALDVLDGKAPSVASQHPEAADIVPPGTILMLGVRDMDEAALPGKPALAKQIKFSLSFLGERDGKSFYHSHTVMANEDVAAQLKTVLDGIQALGLIHVGDNEQGKAMVKAVEIKADGKAVSVNWTGSADDVWDMIVLHAKIVAERRAEHAKKMQQQK